MVPLLTVYNYRPLGPNQGGGQATSSEMWDSVVYSMEASVG